MALRASTAPALGVVPEPEPARPHSPPELPPQAGGNARPEGGWLADLADASPSKTSNRISGHANSHADHEAQAGMIHALRAN